MSHDSWLQEIYRERRHCGTLRQEDNGSEVALTGWAFRYRDQGGLIFIDLRDRSGVVQVVLDRSVLPELFEQAQSIRSEFVLAIRGHVRLRDVEAVNEKLDTGAIEVLASHFELLNSSRPLPFQLDEYTDVGEEVRLHYRYLDIRRDAMRDAVLMRSKLNQSIRRYLETDGFIEVETPVLNKSTPEGARDFLVPSRLHPGHFYALPQSPQIFKQLLMVAGIEKYYQIVKCFRDEDLRADRQPEFTQLDMELSFVDQALVTSTIEKLWKHVFAEVFGMKIELPLPQIGYHDAMERFGSDRPDMRFAMELVDIADLVVESDFKVFRSAAETTGMRVKALRVPGGAALSRKEIDDLTSWVGRDFGAKGLAWVKHEGDGLKSVISKFFSPELLNRLAERCGSQQGDILFFAADSDRVVHATLGSLRLKMAERFELIPEGVWSLLWVKDFPLFERDAETKELISVHHPFTAPLEEDLPILLDAERCKREGEKIRSQAYDMVLNGSEIGGGSIRIHDSKVQSRVFEQLGIDEESAREKFGFLLDGLQFGAPPHGGIAFGLDRVLMLLLGRSSIRDVIAFPKTQKGSCLMSESPSAVAPEQLLELRLRAIRSEGK